MKLSACLLARDEPAHELARAVASVRDYVDEVVLVWTRPKRADEPAVAGVDVVDHFEDCNTQKACGPESECGCSAGVMIDFARARNRSFELARHKAALWLDADDVVLGNGEPAAALRYSLEQAAETESRLYFPYDYTHDAHGNVVNVHWRARLLPTATRWAYPVHEQPAPATGQERTYRSRLLRWEHRRTHAAARLSAERNLRILRHHQTSPVFQNDARFHMFMAHGLFDVGQRIAALPWFLKHFSLEGSREHKAWTAHKIAQCLPIEGSIEWGYKAISLEPEWPSNWFFLAATYRQMSETQKDERDRSRLVRIATQCAEHGLALPEATPNFVPHNPSEWLTWRSFVSSPPR